MRNAELTSLTGIRFYAVLLVFVTHATELPGLEWLRHVHLFKVTGQAGVSVFFVLSGFILTYNYAGVFEGGVSMGSWSQFVWNRLAKIYPMHFLTLLIAVPLQLFSPNLPLDWRAVPVQLLMGQCFLPFAHPPLHAFLNGPSWSISCEFFFYLLAPFAICWLGRWRKLLTSGLILAGYLAVVAVYLYSTKPDEQPGYFQYYFAPTRFIEFMSGICVAFAYLRNTKAMTASLTTICTAAAVILLCAGAILQKLHPWPFQYAINYLPGATLLIYTLSRGRGRVAGHLGLQSMELLGMASYSFYLIHMPVIRCIRGLFRHFHVLVPSAPVIALSVIGCFVIAQVCAIGMFRFLEVPSQQALKRLGRGFRETR